MNVELIKNTLEKSAYEATAASFSETYEEAFHFKCVLENLEQKVQKLRIIGRSYIRSRRLMIIGVVS